jgi:formylglycine-generating enzyme required for sulfatase activity
MTLRHLHIFLSSPSDVSRERQIAREVIDRIQSERAFRDKIKLEVVAWDKPGAGTAMPAHLEPQEAINRGLKKPSECDIVIVVFWARMGTPLSENHLKPDGSRYRSGTEYEFFDGLEAAQKTGKPDVLIYRRKKPPDVNLADPERKEKERQWDLVEEFFSEFRNPDGSFKRFYKPYEEPSDLEKELDQDFRDLITKYLEAHPLNKDEVPAVTPEAFWDVSPFPGLRAFTPEENAIFFGRSHEIDDLISRLSDPKCRFIAVVGASGSGKSSLVAAGLLPVLKINAIHGSGDWVWGRFTPGEVGDNPFMALAGAFKPALERHGLKPRDIAVELEKDAGAFNKFLAKALEGMPKWAELGFFIDQFEELFTLVKKEYQSHFVDFLAQVAKTPRVRTVVTMRADFYHRCLDWPVIDALFKEGHYTLLVPRIGALHEMITRPAERARVRFEEGLAQRILDDTGTEPGALALLAYALSELWAATKGIEKVLKHATYDRFNGVPGAIGKRAEDTFKETMEALSVEEAELQATLGRVFSELIEVDDQGVATRRRAPLSQVTDSAMTTALVSALAEARLLVTGHGEGKVPMVEVAHEAIFTNWPKLSEWIEVRRDDFRLLRQIRLAAAEWEKEGRKKHSLWPHERLLPVSQMVERMQPKLNPTEKEFVRPESERLLEEIDQTSTTHQQRAKIGDRLAEIGDPRPGVGLRKDSLPDIVWTQVPKGEITLEKVEGVFRVDPFHIAKYPVTWVQYRSFLEAEDGYRNIKWWKELTVREDQPGKQHRKVDNHPAENVSWYDAVAFCRWLTEKLSYEVRLPTEWEWQQAATAGDPANEYPWGQEWDSNKANTNESGLDRSTAVGMYPRGVSQEIKALDMGGNVYEWCLNEYENSKRFELSSNVARALRGGSYYHNCNLARCADRGWGCLPGGRNDGFGFRLVCASPIT